CQTKFGSKGWALRLSLFDSFPIGVSASGRNAVVPLWCAVLGRSVGIHFLCETTLSFMRSCKRSKEKSTDEIDSVRLQLGRASEPLRITPLAPHLGGLRSG